ncbi:hypothetical protein AB0L80_21125 [Streptomyces sp. NPDC052069]
MDTYNSKTGVAVGLRNEGSPRNIASTRIRYAQGARVVPAAEAIDLTNPNGVYLIALRHP